LVLKLFHLGIGTDDDRNGVVAAVATSTTKVSLFAVYVVDWRV
jgi:hypothetical protein